MQSIEAVKSQLQQEPHIECDFKIGDRVMFTNDYGIVFGPYEVIGFAKPEAMVGSRFIHIDYASYWFPAKPESLEKIEG